MARKSRRNKSEAHGPRPAPAARPAYERKVYNRQQLAGMFGRLSIAESWETIKQQHGGNPPARLCLLQLADRREAVRVMA